MVPALLTINIGRCKMILENTLFPLELLGEEQEMPKKSTSSLQIKANGTPLKVIELFAGVGGFRLGLKKPHYNVIWSNQWEPATKTQHASEIYKKIFGEKGHSNKDISQVNIREIPGHDLLVGGFPCQDYSVARASNQAKGIVGKKGVLWWEIHRILKEKKRRRPAYLLLENVDRLLKSPTSQRGRDFALMLASLSDLEYAVEWRVINAADYGFPQRRRRIFILGYHKRTRLYKKIKKSLDLSDWILKEGLFAKAFPVRMTKDLLYEESDIKGDLVEISKYFNKSRTHKSPFENSGVIIKRKFVSLRTYPVYNGKKTTLKDVLVSNGQVSEEYYIKDEDLSRWRYLKGAKNILGRSKRTGRTFKYDEGAMVFPDDTDRPSRTIVTGEGGSAPSRFKHVIQANDGRLRRLIPVELERLNMFPDDHTEGVAPSKRAFLMGNAIVVGVVERLGKKLIKEIKK